MLSRNNHEAVGVGDADAAIPRAEQGVFDFVLVDFSLIGIQPRGVGGEGHAVKAACTSKEFLDRVAVVDSSVVEQHDQMAADLRQQVTVVPPSHRDKNPSRMRTFIRGLPTSIPGFPACPGRVR